MAKLIAGVIIGFIFCADVGMVAFCVWYEHRHPSVLKSFTVNDSTSNLSGEK